MKIYRLEELKLKLLDKFLGILKTDRNTFFTYIFTLLTSYIIVDRVVEIILLCMTGMVVSYWNPYVYAFAILCPVFAYSFSISSKFAKSDKTKMSFFFAFWVAIYIIATSMIIQWLNRLAWMGVLSLPNSKALIADFSKAAKRALSLTPIYLIFISAYRLFLWLYKTVNNPIFPNPVKESILDFTGIDLTLAPENSGPYSYEATLCTDRATGKPVKVLEKRRFDSILVIGPSGTGKSGLILEPMFARDLEKKYFFHEAAKEMGYNALKSGLAKLDCPYSKDYLNQFFDLAMLTPEQGKEKAYKSYMKKLINGVAADGTIVYKNLGMSSLTPDASQTYKLAEIAKNFGIPTHIIDPLDPNSPGINPFTLPSPALAGLMISLVLESLFVAASATAELAYMKNLAYQAIQNVCVFLGEMYPRRHNGDLPTLEDLLDCLINFDLVEELCEDLKSDPELSNTYRFQISYFEQNFYKNSPGRKDMQRYVHFAVDQLEELLRAASVRDIICRRRNNLSVPNAIKNGEVILMCTRPTDIGGAQHKGFGLFFLVQMMCAVEGRPGNDKTRIPHFLYVDDFDKYACPLLGDLFTMFRKFRVGALFTAPNLSSLGGTGSPFMQTLLANCSTKVSFGNCTPEEYSWWEKEFGQRREWKVGNSYDTKNGEYSSNLGGSVNWSWEDTMKVAKIQGLKFKTCIYKTKDKKGKNVVNFATSDFLESKYNEPHKSKEYNFDKFNRSSASQEDANNSKKHKFNPDDVDFDHSDLDPVQTDVNDSNYLFDNENAVSYKLDNKKNNNN